MADLFFLVLGLAYFIATVDAQRQLPSTQGFISIDCGSNTTNYTDKDTKLAYVSDEQFTDAGINFQIQASTYQLQTLRSFLDAPRSCYVLKPVTQNSKYLVRATFMYGNYDNKNSANIMFDLYIDVNFWRKVNITAPYWYDYYEYEIIVVALGDSLSVCLADIGSGTPFISVLELRPMDTAMYPAVSTSHYRVNSFRFNVGGPKNIRYPDDPYDRIWKSWSKDVWNNISTTENITIGQDGLLGFLNPPMAVLKTAATPINSSIMDFYWDSTSYGASLTNEHIHFFFSEIVANTSRAFNIYLNGSLWYPNYRPPNFTFGFIPKIPFIDPSERYDWTLNSTGLSSLPPILNALELFTPMYLTNLPTDTRDVNAITSIKAQHHLKRNWMGDPCAPLEYAWVGLGCSYTPNHNPPRITNVTLSSSALNGHISSSFANLTEIKYLDLSYNNLIGSIPDALGNLASLQVLDLRGNNLTGPIPSSLLSKSGQGLRFLIEGNQNLCTNYGNLCEITTKKKITTPVIVVICIVPVTLLLVAIFTLCRLTRSKGLTGITVESKKKILFNLVNGHKDNREFSCKELKKITNNFERVIGKGGFGVVCHGYLEDGTQVAVKMLSQSSSQGTKEFLAEVQHLIRIHHKNLVSLVGYCMEGDCLALVYEYMPQGTLQDHIRGKTSSICAFNWGKRLQIAIEAAEGLEYLHKACKPPLIHRDVKTSNILLNEKLEAKIADFGLSRAFHNDVYSHVSTAVVGTLGYIDPEYYSTYQISEKSDVYSFGVVLLELITAEPPIRADSENPHIVH